MPSFKDLSKPTITVCCKKSIWPDLMRQCETQTLHRATTNPLLFEQVAQIPLQAPAYPLSAAVSEAN